uniref:Uncharacterized protein n=1 Tax=Anguilla anguilla TaxID=7936 RepID=A0A0E9SRE5_ANGAN
MGEPFGQNLELTRFFRLEKVTNSPVKGSIRSQRMGPHEWGLGVPRRPGTLTLTARIQGHRSSKVPKLKEVWCS